MKTLYALLGAPGVGKTTFIRRVSQELFGDETLEHYVIGPDKIRMMVESPVAKPDGTYGISQKNEGYVWSIVNDILDKKVQNGELIIVDATHSRNKAISNYKKYSDRGYRIVLVDFSDYATLDEIYSRNKEREDYKFVPEHVIETMYERIQSLDIPNWVEVIKPEEFKDHFDSIKFNWNGFKDISVIGDIHGCIEEFHSGLKELDIDIYTKDPDRAIVFIGDYFDRGPDPIQVFRVLQKLQKNYFVLPLIGNHEEPLEYYKDFVRDITDDIHSWIGSFTDREKMATEAKKRAQEKKSWLGKAWAKIFPDNLVDLTEEAAEYIRINKEIDPRAVQLLKKFKGQSYKKLDALIESLRSYPNAMAALEQIVWSYNFKNLQHVKRTSRGTMKLFLMSDIKYTEVMDFYKRLGQFCYIDYYDKTYVMTHGGLVDLPTKLTPTADMIRGVGGYDDTLLCDQTFHKKNPDVVSIHGHRNTTDIPIQSTPGTYNINGDVDLGLRFLQITPDEIKTIEVDPAQETLDWYRKKQIEKAKKYNAKKLSADEEGVGLIRLFQDHQHVDVKRLPGDIASINFTRKAFENGVWDDITVKARGLFLEIDTNDNPKQNIIARGYEKFFNIGERYGVDRRQIRELVYPIRAYEKANGYLGILSVDNRNPEKPEWFTASKTTNQGDYAEHFRKMIKPSLNKELKKFMIEKNVTLLFEVIDPEFDPHIEEYLEPELVLLDAVINHIHFDRIPYEELVDFIALMTPQEINVREKKLAGLCETYNAFNVLVNQANQTDRLSPTGIEGFVFEDSAEQPTMFKLKTDWYSFWKYMRSLRDRVTGKLKSKLDRKEEVVLSKSELIQLKTSLHTAEEIKAFNTLVKIAERDVLKCKAMSIPELRKAILRELEKPQE